MNRLDIFQMLLGAGVLLVLIVALTFVRALILRRRRKRKTAQAWRATAPTVEPQGLAEFHREGEEYERQQRLKRMEEEQRRREPEWLNDGEIVLARRKKPPEETP